MHRVGLKRTVKWIFK